MYTEFIGTIPVKVIEPISEKSKKSSNKKNVKALKKAQKAALLREKLEVIGLGILMTAAAFLDQEEGGILIILWAILFAPALFTKK